MARTLTLEGDVNAVDTRTVISAQGSVAAPSLVVPAGMTKIKHILATFAADFVASGNVVGFLRLGGNAVMNGEQVLMLGGHGGTLDAAPIDTPPSVSVAHFFKDVDIEVRPSDTISVAAEIAGTDPGDTTFCVTLIYGND